MMSVRLFEAKDIPLTYAGFWGAAIFDFAKFSENLYNAKNFDMLTFKNDIESVMAEFPMTSPIDIHELRERVAAKFNEKYPSIGFKEEKKFETKPPFPGTPTPNIKEEVDHDTMELLIEKFGLSYKEAKELVTGDAIGLKRLMEVINKVFNHAQDTLRDQILDDVREKFSGKK